MPKVVTGHIDDLDTVKTVSGRADDLAAVESSRPPPDVPPPPPVDVPTLWEMVKKQAYESSPAVLFQRENAAPIAAALAAAAAPATGGASAVPVILAALGGAAGEGMGQGYDAIKEGRAVDLPAAGKAMVKEGAIQGATEGVGGLVAKGAGAVARPVYQWALRPYAGLRKNFGLDTLIETGLRERIPVTKGGTAKATRLRGASSQEARALEVAADTTGAPTVTAQDINANLTELRAKMAQLKKAGLGEQAAALDARIKAIELENPQGASVADVGDWKRNEQDLADKAYKAERSGNPVPIASEAHDAIASSMRNEIEKRVKGVGLKDIGPVNERTRGLIGLTRALGDAEGRTSILGTLLAISGAIGGGGGGLISGHPLLGATVAAPLAMKLMTSPGVLSHGAVLAQRAADNPAVISNILRAFGGKDGFRKWYEQQLAKQQQPSTEATSGQ